MKYEEMTKEQLVKELIEAYQHLAELEKLSGERTETFYSILQKVPYGVALIDKDGNYLFLNPEFTNITGYSINDIPTGRDWFKKAYPDPEYRHMVIDHWKHEIVQKGVDRTFSVMCKNGDVKEIYFRPALLDDSRSIVTLLDMTQRKQAETLLKESEEHYRTAIEYSNDGVAIVREDDHLYVNQKFVEIFGYDRPEEVIGRPISIIIHPDDRERVNEINRRRQRGETVPNRYEFKGIRKDGITINIEVSAAKTTYRGEVVSLVYLRDVTERKRMEDRLHFMSFNDELTSLHNRRGFFTLADQQMKVAQRIKSRMMLFFIDIDDMKWINDTFGHREGDKALLNSATVLKETFRESDIIGRIGGDEFAILAFDTTDMTPELIKSRLQNQLDIHNVQSCPYKLSLSIGISYYDPADPIFIDELMSKADSLMYEHKRAKQKNS